MIITLTGRHGSGKTTVGKLLATKLGYRFISAGDLRGELAMEHGMTIDQLNDIGLREDWTDKEIDKRIAALANEDNVVIDSWIAWHFIPKSFKVFLDIDPVVAARRVFRDQRPDEQHQRSASAEQKMLAGRNANDEARFRKWYGVELYDLSNYDLVLDTTRKEPVQVMARILEEVKHR